MKKIMLFFVALLVCASLPLKGKAQIESPLTNFGLYAGNIYFWNPSGDGTARWAEARLLFGRGNDYRLLSIGGFVNYNEVGSKIDSFLYHDVEWAGGLAMNFGSQYWLNYNEVWGWLNVGLKFTSDHGQIDNYDTRQKDEIFYAFGGIMFKNTMDRGPFFIKKFMVTYQKPYASTRNAYWEGKATYDTATNKGYFKFVAENTFFSAPLTASQNLRLEPKIIGAATYQFWNKRVGLTLARAYSQEIITLDAGIKFDPVKPGNMYSIGVLVNFVELAKAIANK